MSWSVYGTIFRIPAGSGASFTVTGGFLNWGVTGGLKKLVSVFKEASKNLAFDFLIIKTNKILKTTSAYTESTDLTL
jgi:hypothetical protein